ncbi:MAG: hypothetical protein IPI42_08525 [Saprospiraceae bacterium]|nr:hypothetical protein [Candidatus Parvibacillus calidus]
MPNIFDKNTASHAIDNANIVLPTSMKTQWYSGFYVIDALLHRSKGRWSARELLYPSWRIYDSMGFEQLRFVPLFFLMVQTTSAKTRGYS